MTFPLWCLFVAALMLVLTKMPVAVAMHRSSAKGYDNRHPRAQQAALTGWGARALAAHQNMFEAFPLFAAGVLVAHSSSLHGSTIDLLAGVFVLMRVIYTACYLANWHALRSLSWITGFLCCLGLLLSPALA
ncbi:MAPEG family protein [Pseudomonas sp.]|jgi:uncharacterized MAPEG superfamily protein|uniref:MAPEG family protein n=1 Tax=Pseudomonas sp. TaxID=306 RepID=UPI00272C0D58|nr:MAPEG family protein [Pseudomonas sp.]